LKTRLCVALALVAVALAAAAGCAGHASKSSAAPAAASAAAAAPPAEHTVALAELAKRVSAALPGCPVEAADNEVRAMVPAGQVFEADGVALQGDVSAVLGKLAHLLRACRSCAVDVVVHTDAIGPAAANLEFSGQRADALAAWLQSAGVPESRLRARGAGEGAPVADNSTPGGRQANRRIEISIRP
jgi:outer membrane protein OmpA-like peptidoglycan-associated protein